MSILSVIVFCMIQSYAEIKKEIIDEYIHVTHTKDRYAETLKKLIPELIKTREAQGVDIAFIEPILNKHCTWDSWKPFLVNTLDETYTKDDLKLLIEFYSNISPELKKVFDKQVDYYVKDLLAQKRWQEELWKTIKPEVIGTINSREQAKE